MNELSKYLIAEIAGELNINRGAHESLNDWNARIVFSALGRMASASLYDKFEDDLPVSVNHIKSRIGTLYRSFLQLEPALEEIFKFAKGKLHDHIYNILIAGGCIYHSPNEVSPPAYVEAKSGQVIFVRGAPLNDRVFVSGLGTYITDDGRNCRLSLAGMFGLQRISLAEYWEQLTSKLELEPFRMSVQLEYLRTEPDFRKGYFKPQPDTDGRISLMRTKTQGTKIYYLYTLENDRLTAKQLPSWQTDNYEYSRISNAIIHNRGKLPSAVFHVDGAIVSLELQYLYPPSELNMLRLYSWPGRYNFNPFRKYILALPVFHAIRPELERIGYTFTEE